VDQAHDGNIFSKNGLVRRFSRRIRAAQGEGNTNRLAQRNNNERESRHGPKSHLYVPETKKSTLPPLTFAKVRFFLPELQNRTKHLPQLLKSFILPPWPGSKRF